MAHSANSGDDISVIVQGPVVGTPNDSPEKQATLQALTSARVVWPQCELILSTWNGTATSHLPFDHLVTSDDPGGIPFNDGDLKNRLNNLNRQIVSTRRGLDHATRHFAVKLRSDCKLLRPLDIDLLSTGQRHAPSCLLQQRVITLNLYTRHPLRRPVLCHLSDIFQIGLLADLRTIWSAPVVEEPAFTRAVDPFRRPTIRPYPEHDFQMRCAAEQYLVEQLIRRRHSHFSLEHQASGGVRALFIWLRVLANNFHLLTPTEAGVQVPPHIAGHETDWDLFQPSDRPWLELWTHDHVPLPVRLHAAMDYCDTRLAFSPLTPLRARCRGVLRRLRSTRRSWIRSRPPQAN